jgi:hypothetical protein
VPAPIEALDIPSAIALATIRCIGIKGEAKFILHMLFDVSEIFSRRTQRIQHESQVGGSHVEKLLYHY